MTSVYISCFDEKRNSRLRELAQSMPSFVREKMLSFKRSKDAQLYLLGKLLLLKGFFHFGYSNLRLDHLKFNEYNKPYVSKDLYFNISHSGDYVVCAISKECQVGIDIEQIKEINFEDFRSIFSENEKAAIIEAEDSLRFFYYIWTRKEAVVKADGRGFSISLSELEVLEREVQLFPNKWFLKELNLNNDYIIHLAMDKELVANVIFQSIDF